MNNNILLDKPNVRFETHARATAEFPFIIKRHKDHSKSPFGIHENLELLLFLDGNGAVLYDGNRYSVGKGDVVVVNSYTIHQVVSEEELPLFCLIIDRRFCQYCGVDPMGLHFQSLIRDDQQLSALFRKMMDAYEERDSQFGNPAFKCAVLELLLYLCRYYSTPRQEDASKSPALEHVRRAVGYMRANFAQKISCEDIAASAGLSKFHFQREFKRITGKTPNHYLNAIRCVHARRLLESGGYSVKEVAFLCGFTNNSYFSYVFCRYIGVLPSQVRPIGEMAKNVAVPAGIYYNENIKKRR